MKQRLLYIGILLAVLVLLFPASALSWPPYGYGPPQPLGSPSTYPGAAGAPYAAPGLQLQRSADQDNYYLTIRVVNLDPQTVTVVADGRWLNIGTTASDQSSNQETFDAGRGYARSFSYSSNRLSRRLSVPRDADTAAMERQDAADSIRITIPRAR